MADTNEPTTAAEEQNPDPQFEPVIKLTEQVESKTMEEDEEAIFKMRAKLFRFNKTDMEWKERGTGDVRLLQTKSTPGKEIRLVMRRDKTLKVCANHFVSSNMVLAPNVGSDRSWVWNVAADYSEAEPTSETLAIRFANSDNANLFKKAFEDAAKHNEDNKGASSKPAADAEPKDEAKDLSKALESTSIAEPSTTVPKTEKEITKEESPAAPAPTPAVAPATSESVEAPEPVKPTESIKTVEAVVEEAEPEAKAEVVEAEKKVAEVVDPETPAIAAAAETEKAEEKKEE